MRTNMPAILLGAATVTLFAACTMDFGGFQFGSELSSGGGTTTGPGSGGAGIGGGILVGGGQVGPGGNMGGQGGVPQGGDGGTPNGPGGAGGAGGGGVIDVLCDDAQNLCDVFGDGKCCLPFGGSNPQCLPSGNCMPTDTTVDCDEPSDCPGQECCATFVGLSYTVLQCVNNCMDVIVCDTTNDCDGSDTCQQSQYLPMGYQVCIN